MATASFVTDLTEVLTQAVEAAAGIGSLISGFKNVSLARSYYNLYNTQRQYYYATFQQGVEKPLAAATYTDPYYNLNYAGRIATLYDPNSGPLGGSSTDIAGWWSRHGAMYATAPDPLIVELNTDTARLQVDWANYLFRFEELWFDIRNDTRWAKRLAVHNIGIKQGNAISHALDYSLSNYQDNIVDMASQLATYGNGIAKYAGYKRGLNDVSTQFQTNGGYQDKPSPFRFDIDAQAKSSANANAWQGAPFLIDGGQ